MQKTIQIKKIIKKWKEKPDGKGYYHLSIGDGERWYQCRGNPVNKTWKEGDSVTVEVEQNGEWNNIIFPRENLPQPQKTAVGHYDVEERKSESPMVYQTDAIQIIDRLDRIGAILAEIKSLLGKLTASANGGNHAY